MHAEIGTRLFCVASLPRPFHSPHPMTLVLCCVKAQTCSGYKQVHSWLVMILPLVPFFFLTKITFFKTIHQATSECAPRTDRQFIRPSAEMREVWPLRTRPASCLLCLAARGEKQHARLLGHRGACSPPLPGAWARSSNTWLQNNTLLGPSEGDTHQRTRSASPFHDRYPGQSPFQARQPLRAPTLHWCCQARKLRIHSNDTIYSSKCSPQTTQCTKVERTHLRSLANR